MLVTCPSCGAQMDLAVLLAHEDSRHALSQLAQISLPFASLTIRYLALFKPAARQMSHQRFVALVAELLPDMQRQAIERKGREWDAPLESWRAALEYMLEQRDAGKLSLPLKSHGYLHEVLMGQAEKVEAEAERQAEAQRRGSRGHSAGPQRLDDAIADMDRALAGAQSSVDALAQRVAPSGPSKAAQRIKAEMAARIAARAGRVHSGGSGDIAADPPPQEPAP